MMDEYWSKRITAIIDAYNEASGQAYSDGGTLDKQDIKHLFIDLIADIRFYCMKNNIAWTDVVKTVQMHFISETLDSNYPTAEEEREFIGTIMEETDVDPYNEAEHLIQDADFIARIQANLPSVMITQWENLTGDSENGMPIDEFNQTIEDIERKFHIDLSGLKGDESNAKAKLN